MCQYFCALSVDVMRKGAVTPENEMHTAPYNTEGRAMSRAGLRQQKAVAAPREFHPINARAHEAEDDPDRLNTPVARFARPEANWDRRRLD